MSAALIWAGAVIAAFASVRLLLTRDPFLRLHFVSVGSVLGAPLVIAGLVLMPWSSWHDVAELLVIGVLLFVTGPATVITTAHAVKRGSGG